MNLTHLARSQLLFMKTTLIYVTLIGSLDPPSQITRPKGHCTNRETVAWLLFAQVKPASGVCTYTQRCPHTDRYTCGRLRVMTELTK